LYRVAIHEAAHAVALVRLGFGCSEVSLDERHGELSGRAEFDGELSEGAESLKRIVTVYFVGCAAEVHARFSTERAIENARLDFGYAEPYRKRLGRAGAETYCFRRATNFVWKHWNAILLVARELAAHRQLGGLEVELLLDVADGNAPDPGGLD